MKRPTPDTAAVSPTRRKRSALPLRSTFRAEREHVQTGSLLLGDHQARRASAQPVSSDREHRGARSVNCAVARLLRACRFVSSTDRKATRNALTDRWRIVSLNRRDGWNSLPLPGLRKCLPGWTARRAAARTHLPPFRRRAPGRSDYNRLPAIASRTALGGRFRRTAKPAARRKAGR